MRAGALNTLISIESQTHTINSVGDKVETWSTYVKSWAEIKTQSGKEFIQANEINSSVEKVLRIRYVAGINPTMRVNNSGVYYNILSVFDPTNERRELTLYCNVQL